MTSSRYNMDVMGETEKKVQPPDDEKRKYRMRGNELDLLKSKPFKFNYQWLKWAQWWYFCFDIAAAFLATVSGMAAIGGFSRTITTARKQDQKLYEQATVETVNLIEAGSKLATRALAWGTFYAFLGTGTFVYGIWKLSGAKNVFITQNTYYKILITK